MKQTIELHNFRDAFKNQNRESNFSYEGLEALYDYLIELEQDCGTEQELDVIAICCDFVEYESLQDFHKEYDAETYPDMNAIKNETTVIEIDAESFIIQAF